MSSLFRNPASATGGSNGLSASDMQARKEQIKAEVQTALQTANAQELINKMGEKCFVKCITKPGTSIGLSEEGCIARCQERYMEAFNVISKTYVARIGKEREAVAVGGGAYGVEGLN